MNKIIYVLVAALALIGCQKRDQGTTASIPQERREMGRKLVLKSLQDLENKDLTGAISTLEASIKVDPVDAEAYLLLGQILLKVGEYERATAFLDQTAKNFPDNGTAYYMLSVANKMSGKKLPAVLAARRSAEIFQQAQDKDNMLKAAVLLQDLINTPDADFVPAKKPATPQIEAAPYKN